MASDRAVLFDLDGVIIDSRAHHINAWEQLAREGGYAHAQDFFTQTFGLRNDAILTRLAPGIEPARVAELAARKETLYRALARGDARPLAGVPELLAFLQEEGVPAAVVTSAPRANLELVANALGIRARFAALVAEEDARRGKPDPEGFLVAAARVGVAPGRCVVIEDAPAGLQAAKAGGMRAIGVTTTHPAADLGDADLVVDSLAEVKVRAFIFRVD